LIGAKLVRRTSSVWLSSSLSMIVSCLPSADRDRIRPERSPRGSDVPATVAARGSRM